MKNFQSFKPTWVKSFLTIIVAVVSFLIALDPCNVSRCIPGDGICGSAYCHFPTSWVAWLIWPIAFYLIWSLVESRSKDS